MICKIGELCLKIGSGGTPSRRKKEYYENGTVRWLKTKELEDTTIYDTEEYITEEALKSSSAKLFPKNTITIAMYGATVGKLGILKEEMATNQACCNMVVDKEKCDYRFLYYSLLINRDKLINLANGAAQQNLNKSVIENFEINIFTIEEQRKIADTLWALDKKIQLNNEMNKTLEEMAQVLFKRWFVDFEFPNEDGEPYKSNGGEMVESELGMIPKGWRIYSIYEVCDLNKSNYSIKEKWEYINYLDTANITNNKIDNIQKIDCENEKVPSRAKRKVKRDSIVYSTVRPNQLHYGIIKNPIENMIVSTGFVVLDGKIDFIKNDIIYYWLIQDNNTELLQSIGETSTSTYPSIKPSDIGTMKLALPPKEIIKNLEEKFDKINVLIDELKREEKQLIELRDSLLPKLMSGEIRVEEIEANL